MPQNKNHALSRKPNRIDKLTLIIAIAFVAVALVTAVLAFRLVGNLVRSWTMTPLDGISINPAGTKVNMQGTPVPPNIPLQENAGPTPQPWDGASRVTMLLIGLDYRDWETGNVPLSDTMMLLTLDPLSKTAGILSIPRDMWVNIPGGYGYHKINQAYFFGVLNKIPGGGPGLAVDTVRKFIGVPINYYAQVDFMAFTNFINEIGGVEIDVPEDIRVDPLGEGNTVYLKKGVQVLSGEVALGYARNRADGGDIARADRQQQVIMAIRDKVLNLNMLPTLIARAPALYGQISAGVKTNLTLEQVVQLALLAQQVKKDNITRGVIGANGEVEPAMSPDGLSILIPIPDRIRMLRDKVFSTSPQVGPSVIGADTLKLAKAENARISVRNGSTTNGLAGRTAEYLRGQGLNVVEETNADRVYESSTIILQSGKPYTQEYLRALLSVPTARILNQYAADANIDLILILGNDWARKNPMP